MYVEDDNTTMSGYKFLSIITYYKTSYKKHGRSWHASSVIYVVRTTLYQLLCLIQIVIVFSFVCLVMLTVVSMFYIYVYELSCIL